MHRRNSGAVIQAFFVCDAVVRLRPVLAKLTSGSIYS